MLFIIDMQNDFVDNEKGVLAVPNAAKIVPKIIEEIHRQEEKGEPIYYTINQHDLENDHRSDEEKKWGMALFGPL